jgi:tRNA(fMet)-specific endonuclease VapC
MLYLLDTNVLIEIRRNHPGVLKRMLLHAPTEICYSVISLGELHKGLIQQSPEQAAVLWEQWRRILAPFTPIDFTAPAAVIWGRLLHTTRKQPIGPRDLLIAATALADGMTVVTHNVKEFQRIESLLLEDWQDLGPESRQGA